MKVLRWWLIRHRAMHLFWHCRCCIIRSGFMLFIYSVIWPRNFSVDRAPSALRVLIWVMVTVDDNLGTWMLVYCLMKLCTEVVHYLLFVLWTLPDSREARFCTSEFKTYSIVNTINIRLTYRLSLSLSLHVRTAQYEAHDRLQFQCRIFCDSTASIRGILTRGRGWSLCER
jgi:hypothetical protein